MTYDYIKLQNTISEIMCTRCGNKLRSKCYFQRGDSHLNQMCICIKKVLEPNDEKYPTGLKL